MGALVVGAISLIVDGPQVVAVVNRGEGLDGRVPLSKEAIALHLVVEAEAGVYFAGGKDISDGHEGIWGLLGEGEVNLLRKKLIGVAVEPRMAEKVELLGEGVIEEGVGGGGEGRVKESSLTNKVEVREDEVGEAALEEGCILLCEEEGGNVVFEGEGVGVPEGAVGDAPAAAFTAFIEDVTGCEARIGFLVVEGEVCSQDKLGGAPLDISLEGEETILAVPVAGGGGEGFGLGGVVEDKGPWEDSEVAVDFVEEGICAGGIWGAFYAYSLGEGSRSGRYMVGGVGTVDSSAGIGEGAPAGIGGGFVMAVVGEVLGAEGDGAEGGYDLSLVGQETCGRVIGKRLSSDGAALTDKRADGTLSLEGVCRVKRSLLTEELDSILAKDDGAAQVAHLVGAAKFLSIFYQDGLGGSEGD